MNEYKTATHAAWRQPARNPRRHHTLSHSRTLNSFEQVDEPAAKGPCLQLETAESLMYLLTYDQNPDSQCVRSGHFKIICHARTLPPANSREAPYFAVALNWNRSRATVSAPCFVALGMSSGRCYYSITT